jgi:hypothetical protein
MDLYYVGEKKMIVEQIVFLSLSLFGFFMITILIGIIIVRKNSLKIEYWKLILPLAYTYIEVFMGIIYYFNIYEITTIRSFISIVTLVVAFLLFYLVKKFIHKYVYLTFFIIVIFTVFIRFYGAYIQNTPEILYLRVIFSFIMIVLLSLVIVRVLIGNEVNKKILRNIK